MDLRLDGKVALITGGSRGIGKAIAKLFVESGAKVVISSRKKDSLEEAANEIGGEISYYCANAGEPDQVRACVGDTIDRLGGLDILVSNAATNPYMGPMIEIDLPRADKTVQVNQRAVLVWAQSAWELWMKENGGNIINMASIGGITVEPGIGYYNVTKAAVIHLTKQMAFELQPKVRVNAIAPGLVKTDFARSLWEPAEEFIASRIPMRRLGEQQDIASAALYLASEASSWMTGHTLVIDGGALIGGHGGLG